MNINLLTNTVFRVQRLSLADQWMVFEGDEAANPQFSVRKRMNLLNSRSLAQVSWINSKEMYEIQGCYPQRCCGVYDEKRRLVAEIKRKEAEAMGGHRVALGLDVFHLLVYEPHIDPPTAMAIVILLDHMFEPSTSNRRFSFALAAC